MPRYFLIPVVLLALVFAAPASAADKSSGDNGIVQAGGVQQDKEKEELLNPDPSSVLSTPAPELSDEQHESLLARKRQLEEGATATTQNNPPSPAGLPPVEGRGTAGAAVHQGGAGIEGQE